MYKQVSLIMINSSSLINNCLYFTTNSLSRIISKIAEEEFKPSGLFPSHAFVLMKINEHQNISPNELAKMLNFAPSTVTRFLDNLEKKGFIFRKTEGKTAIVSSTPKGEEKYESILICWKNLNEKYEELLGQRLENILNVLINQSLEKLK